MEPGRRRVEITEEELRVLEAIIKIDLSRKEMLLKVIKKESDMGDTRTKRVIVSLLEKGLILRYGKWKFTPNLDAYDIEVIPDPPKEDKSEIQRQAMDEVCRKLAIDLEYTQDDMKIIDENLGKMSRSKLADKLGWKKAKLLLILAKLDKEED